jgi:tetratricopeptide (TPR) repeat protein
MAEPREYWAFISYRHLDNQDPGREWATWIAREIETYEVPADLVGTRTERGEVIPERLYPVFRDEDELSAGADLSSPIYQALRRSKSLVLICSPRTIGSRYVGNEITYYKSLDRPCGALAMMIEGEPHSGDQRECFPRELKHPIDTDGKLDTSREVEPVAADFRLPNGCQGWHSLEECRKNLADEATVTRYRERCELAKLKIIAGILGVPLGTLIERDKAYQLAQAKKRARVIGGVAVAMALLAVLAITAGIFAWQKREQAIKAQAAAEQTRDAAEGLVESIIFDLRDKLEPIGRIELLDDSTTAAENYFANLPSSMVNEESERRRSIVLASRAGILENSGDLDGALEKQREGLEIARQQAAADPDDPKPQQEVAISLQEIADILLAQNLPAEASQPLDEAEAILARTLENLLGPGGTEPLLASLLGENGEKLQGDALAILKESPGIADLFASAAAVAERLGNIAQLNGDSPDALAHYEAALRVQQAMAAAQPDTDYWRRGQASGHDKIGNVFLLNEDYPAAREQFRKLTDIAEQELEQQPDNAHWKDLFAGALDRLSTIDSFENKPADRLERSRRAMEIWKELAEADPGNLTRQRNLFVGLHKLGLSLLAVREPADTIFDEARSIARRLVNADPTNATWRRDLAFSLDRLANGQRSAGEQEAALATANEALGHHRQLSEGDPNNLQLRRNLLLTLNGIAINRWALEDRDAALKNFTESAQLAASILDDLVEPTLQSFKDLGEVCVYSAQVAEEAGQSDEALSWYRKALDVVLSARELELVGAEAETESIQPLREKISALEGATSKPEK